jgi:hypothetical protein
MKVGVGFCLGCGGAFDNHDISEEGYCWGCQYEKDAKLDHETGGEDE